MLQQAGQVMLAINITREPRTFSRKEKKETIEDDECRENRIRAQKNAKTVDYNGRWPHTMQFQLTSFMTQKNGKQTYECLP